MGKYSVNKLLQSSRSVKEQIAEGITYIRARGTREAESLSSYH
jgi:hypothetical protein